VFDAALKTLGAGGNLSNSDWARFS
jgi:hypothetical protein